MCMSLEIKEVLLMNHICTSNLLCMTLGSFEQFFTAASHMKRTKKFHVTCRLISRIVSTENSFIESYTIGSFNVSV